MFITGDVGKVTLKMSGEKTEFPLRDGLAETKKRRAECSRFFNLD
jgi:hypothetical protein